MPEAGKSRSALSKLRSPYAALAVVCAAVFLGALDQTVVVTVLPTVIAEMRLPFTKLDQASWVVTGYLLGYTAVMPLMGRVSDVHGRRRVILIALAVFMLASIACARSSSLNGLVWARAFQAIGGGALVPIAMALVGDLFPPQRRSVALGIVGAAAEAGGVLGPLYGAVVVHFSDWRWIFWLNLPLGAVIAVLCLVSLPKTKRLAEKLDYVGAALLAGSLVLLTIALTNEANAPRPVSQTLLFLAGFAVLFALFLLREFSISHALIDLRMFKNPTFSAANIVNFLVGAGLIVAMVDVPMFSVAVLNRSSLDSGLILIRFTAMIPLGAVLGGYACRWVGYRGTTAAGLVLSAIGFLLLSQWQVPVSDGEMTRGLVVAGFGFGLVIAPISAAVLNSVRQSEAGIASALITVMRMVGMTVGLAALTSWGLTRFNVLSSSIPIPIPLPNETAEQTQARLQAYQDQVLQASMAVFNNIFTAAAILCVLALLPVLFLRPKAETDVATATIDENEDAVSF